MLKVGLYQSRWKSSWNRIQTPQTATSKKAQDDFFVAPIVDVTAFALSRGKRFRTWTTSFWVFFLMTSVHSLTSVRISSKKRKSLFSCEVNDSPFLIPPFRLLVFSELSELQLSHGQGCFSGRNFLDPDRSARQTSTANFRPALFSLSSTVKRDGKQKRTSTRGAHSPQPSPPPPCRKLPPSLPHLAGPGERGPSAPSVNSASRVLFYAHEPGAM